MGVGLIHCRCMKFICLIRFPFSYYYLHNTNMQYHTLTKDMFMFFNLQARLKMDRRLRSSHRNRRVITLINELSLTKCSNTRLKSLSGGETKKVSLAVQVRSGFSPTLNS